MSLFSGIYHEDSSSIVDEENSLTIPCNENTSRNFFLLDGDLVGGTYLALPDGMLLISNVRTINLSPSRQVVSERRPLNPFETLQEWDEFEDDEEEYGENGSDEEEVEETSSFTETSDDSTDAMRHYTHTPPISGTTGFDANSMYYHRSVRRSNISEGVTSRPNSPERAANPQRRPELRSRGRRFRW